MLWIHPERKGDLRKRKCQGEAGELSRLHLSKYRVVAGKKGAIFARCLPFRIFVVCFEMT